MPVLFLKNVYFSMLINNKHDTHKKNSYFFNWWYSVPWNTQFRS
ncbi:hypothetical protein FLAVO9AF_230011 [Flavobacterium sp. 9AF]|nr:hypothetical protein FLAVO9AF_230011 [Flavobacterium sp. 9AF]